jgi:hypothetical protein
MRETGLAAAITEKIGLCAKDLKELTRWHVMRIRDDYPVDEDPGMRLEHIHDHFTAEAVGDCKGT